MKTSRTEGKRKSNTVLVRPKRVLETDSRMFQEPMSVSVCEDVFLCVREFVGL